MYLDAVGAEHEFPKIQSDLMLNTHQCKRAISGITQNLILEVFLLLFRWLDQPGGLPEWPMGADCKSAGLAFSGSNPLPTTSALSSKPISR